MEPKQELLETEICNVGGDYQIIAWYFGHELIYFEKYGSYQGEWLMVSFLDDEYYIWKGWYGSCSGCDAYEAEFSWREDSLTRGRMKEFCENYDPFVVIPKDTMINIVRGGEVRVKEIMPANERDWYDVSIDEVAEAIYISCKIHANVDLQTDDILNAKNIELRQLGLEIYGLDRFIKDADAKIIHSDANGDLLAVEEIRMLRVKDSSTDRNYLIPVPDSIERVRQGLAWTFGLQENEYDPLIET